MSATLPISANDRTVTITATMAEQTAFVFDFPIQSATDLLVKVAAAATPRVWSEANFAAGDYTVSGVGVATGGRVFLAVGRAIGDLVQISGATAIDRTSSITRGGAYRSAAIDADLDRQTMVSQELRRDIDALDVAAIEAVAVAVDQSAEIVAEMTAVAQDAAAAANASAASSANSEASAHSLVIAATAGFSGFAPNTGYDFGLISDPVTYFNQDWGALL